MTLLLGLAKKQEKNRNLYLSLRKAVSEEVPNKWLSDKIRHTGTGFVTFFLHIAFDFCSTPESTNSIYT